VLRAISIIGLSIAAAVVYGLIHDQITIRISPEYFTVLHPRILPEDTSLTVLALAWGVIATWWVGAILGVILAGASCLGNRPTLSAAQLLKPILGLLLIMGCGAAICGTIGHALAVKGTVLIDALPPQQAVGATTAWFTHLASYALGFIGGITLSIRAWKQRGRARG
jgi:hypothetical protein